MYCNYFGFNEKPFSIAPDPGFLYMSERHREALAHLLYGVKSDSGFVLLTGEVGTGKTTICRCLLEQMPETSKVAYVINPRLSVLELLATICDEFAIKYPTGCQSIKLFVDLINEYLLDAYARGLKPVLIIDEAQNLTYDLLEQVRLLTNLETNERKLLLIVMLGQPELREKLLQPEMRQLQQRITARYHLGALDKKDTAAYVGHRLAVAGVRRKLFKQPALNRLFKLSGGVPRLINLLCDRALLGAYAHGEGKIDKRILQKAATEIMDGGKKIASQDNHGLTWALAGILVMLIIIGTITGNLTSFSTAYDYSRTAVANVVSGFGSKSPTVAPPKNTYLPPCLISHGIEIEAPADDLQPPDIEDESFMPQTEVTGTEPLFWPADQPRARNKIMAYKSLFEQWGTTYDDSKYRSACNQAVTVGLRCLYKQGNLGTLRRLNRPAVLRFIDGEGEEYFAALVGLQDEAAHLMVGGELEVVSIPELERQWTGAYTMLWKMPEGYQGAVLPGKSAIWLPWLNNRLAVIDGQDVNSTIDGDVLQGDLLEKVKDFQHENGLASDGILGPQTIISLNSLVVDSFLPSLSENKLNPIQISKN